MSQELIRKGADRLLIRRHEAPVSMRRGARLPGAELAFLSRLGSASRTTNGQSWIF